ncbi:MAG: alpha-1,4-glucan--maltose-1-phosphate maltosyltransferase [Xanthobacteraceae bacterium]|nr:alpha-1,4-glucan--maltose-1-phosphate maltosyltransferase [Xanthobacteraceae bacterium]
MSVLPPVRDMVYSSVNSSGAGGFHIEDLYPRVDDGRFAVKRMVGDPFDVWADIFRSGHDILAANLLWREEASTDWSREPMVHHGNDRWTATFTPRRVGHHVYAIEAWTDEYATWRHGALAKQNAGQDVSLDALEGAALLTKARPLDKQSAALLTKAAESFLQDGSITPLLAEDIAQAMAHSQTRADLTRSKSYPLMVDRPRAVASAWYEMVPRSQGKVQGKHGTFKDCITRLPDVAAMGFDVVYFTPIHPIGRINRKGRNNALKAEAGDPGSPYAIGAEEGGHDAVHLELGTLENFRELVHAANSLGMEIALDFAVQCAPDHPWVTQHPDWFNCRPDGTMRYAENPPKKYEDIHNPDFSSDDAGSLWNALRDVVWFWVEQGVKIFRVDNPHTKPFPFWEWLIKEIQSRDPDVIFLAEAFTRPKLMKGLAKLGFTQSYTYFTWRTGKHELQEYLSELTAYPERDYYRPNFFVTTPDILPYHLQSGEPWAFKSRLALAATLSGSYGIYNGFELLEHEAIPGKEEYLNSEKYEIKVRDWDAPGNIKPYIRGLNRARKNNSALLQTAKLKFLGVDNDQTIAFSKTSTDSSNTVIVAIALSREPREFWLPLGNIGFGAGGETKRIVAVENVITGERHGVEWGGIRLRIDPLRDPALLFRCLI